MLDFIGSLCVLILIGFIFFVTAFFDYKEVYNDCTYKRFKIRETRRLIRRLEKDGARADEIAKIIGSIEW